MDIFVDIQGFKAPPNQFVVKEFAVIFIEGALQNQLCLFFKEPFNWKLLPQKFQVINRWYTRNYHGLQWDSGEMAYKDMPGVIDDVIGKAKFIYVKGLEKKEWMHQFVNNRQTVINLEDLNCPSLHIIPDLPRWKHASHHGPSLTSNCALKNVRKMKMWFDSNSINKLRPVLRKLYTNMNFDCLSLDEIHMLPEKFLIYFEKEIEDIKNKLID